MAISVFLLHYSAAEQGVKLSGDGQDPEVGVILVACHYVIPQRTLLLCGI